MLKIELHNRSRIGHGHYFCSLVLHFAFQSAAAAAVLMQTTIHDRHPAAGRNARRLGGHSLLYLITLEPGNRINRHGCLADDEKH